MSDTPRTDQRAFKAAFLPPEAIVTADFGRELERELNSATADLVVMQARVAAMQRCIDERTDERNRVQSVLAKIDAVRTHQSEKLVRLIDAVEAMGYEWRWTKSIDADGEQVGAWVMKQVGEWVMLDAAEADANNERFRRTDGE
jgi:hypothetical protein